MATFTNTTKSSAPTWTDESKNSMNPVSIAAGTATGLLTPPTYAEEIVISAGWNNETKN